MGPLAPVGSNPTRSACAQPWSPRAIEAGFSFSYPVEHGGLWPAAQWEAAVTAPEMKKGISVTDSPEKPAGEERKVTLLSSAAIDGAPLSYIITLAAVAAVLAFVPFSTILTFGGSFPLSQGVFPLIGWILGPVAGALASAIGRLIGIFLAPHTAGAVPLASVWGAAIGSFAAGTMSGRDRGRSWWWIPLAFLFVAEWLLFIGRGVLVNGVDVGVAILYSFIHWSSLILYILPTRVLFARWIRSENALQMALGLFFGTWMAAAFAHLSVGVILYYMFNWPNEVWVTLIPIIPIENAFRGLVGAVIGTGVIQGLRAVGLVKPKWALY